MKTTTMQPMKIQFDGFETRKAFASLLELPGRSTVALAGLVKRLRHRGQGFFYQHEQAEHELMLAKSRSGSSMQIR